MHEDWAVCALVTLGESPLVVGECVNPMFVDAPCTGIPCNRRCPLSGPPAPQSNIELRAMNSGSLNTSAKVPVAALLKSPPTKSKSSSFMCAYSRWRSEVAASRFLATMLCKWTEQNVTVFGASTGGLRRSPRTTNAARPLFDDQVLDRVWQERVIVEEDGQTSVD